MHGVGGWVALAAILLLALVTAAFVKANWLLLPL
ncbi:hypothetical protein [Marinomonas gallaica]